MTTIARVADKYTLTCTGCGRTRSFYPHDRKKAPPVETYARCAGWRVHDGQTIGGAPLRVRLCQICAGTATPDQVQDMTSFNAMCDTCGREMVEDWADERAAGYVFTEKDADEWCRDHRCEPSTSVVRPK